ncbi:hydroxyisourate hydrolase [Yunchengibacter salinarum]|uniref:hydroxyisourate hydrolase n=1 Tax=Yunchengibacter salinarum TaxID=3133399 RepID=UPI0035B68AF5
MGFLTTHVLDTAHGCPAAGMTVVLYRLEADSATREIKRIETNQDGRADGPILPESGFAPGTYRLDFHVGDYYRRKKEPLPEPAFLDVVPVLFGMAEDSHYHVPLLVSPYGYSTYRGS